jgi:hypothetical protein
MIFRDATQTLQRMLAPVPLDEFLDETLGRRFIKIAGDGQSDRALLLGNDPERIILDAFREVAPNIRYHSAAPSGSPPSIEPVSDSRAFKAKIDAFHALGYTVKIPQPRWLTPQLDEFLRALEFLFHQPATAEVFWSRGDARAPAHHDDYDLIAIQLKGRKRWFISTDQSSLPNPWKSIPTPPPKLERHEVVEVAPGDLLYLPRGTDHRVDALSDSVHVTISFFPLTVRDAICATLDHLADLDRTFREAIGSRLAFSVRSNNFSEMSPRIRDGLARLMQLCGSDEFIAQALQRRSSRAIGELTKSNVPAIRPQISPSTRVRHSPSAIGHLLATREQIDFSHPGGHVYIHRGVELCAKYIAETPAFRVSDIPGQIGDDIRIALAEKFISNGFLEIVPE